MLRVAAWTAGLFAIGAGVAHFFPGSWTEPLVLAAMGVSMLLLGGRGTSRPAEQLRSVPSQRERERAVAGAANGVAPAASNGAALRVERDGVVGGAAPLKTPRPAPAAARAAP